MAEARLGSQVANFVRFDECLFGLMNEGGDAIGRTVANEGIRNRSFFFAFFLQERRFRRGKP
jgi:hypothetical protein